ncbi:MAG: hypothetical protein QOG54_2080 [Actinomycetota bacterium]|jgi:hypothetical protein|nr:hypothetical protein [Actinomycetota bacterium]
MSFIPYEEFGVNFVKLAVTPERIKAAVEETGGGSFQFGPMGVGPGGVAVVKADGQMGEVHVEMIEGPELRFEAMLPIDMNLEVRLAGVPNRYRGVIDVPLSLIVRTQKPLCLLIEVEPVAARDVKVDLRSDGISAQMLQKVGNMDEEVQRQVARVVNERINAESAKASREFDIATMIEGALDH